jgi:hypothetical protein
MAPVLHSLFSIQTDETRWIRKVTVHSSKRKPLAKFPRVGGLNILERNTAV